MKAAVERFVAGGLDRDDVELKFVMFKKYFDEPFIDDEEREMFWRTIDDARYLEACGKMLPAHAMWLFEMSASMEGE